MTTKLCTLGTELGGSCSPARNTLTHTVHPDGTFQSYITFPSDGEEHLAHEGSEICELHTQLYLGALQELGTAGVLEGQMRLSREDVSEERIWKAGSEVVLSWSTQ